MSTSWNRNALEQVVEAVHQSEEEKRATRAQIYTIKKYLRAQRLKVVEFPWGYTIDGRHLSEQEWTEAKARIEVDLDARSGHREE